MDGWIMAAKETDDGEGGGSSELHVCWFMILVGWVCKEQIEVSLKVVGVFGRLFGCCFIGDDDVVV